MGLKFGNRFQWRADGSGARLLPKLVTKVLSCPIMAWRLSGLGGLNSETWRLGSCRNRLSRPNDGQSSLGSLAVSTTHLLVRG
jgi:hypothetical protein